MDTWITSDCHFSHSNIIKYCNRPWTKGADENGNIIPDPEEMDKELIKRWNSVVKKDDIVWNLGDFCFGSMSHISDIVKQLNGRINLILGNHDHHKLEKYYEIGFHRVYDHPVLIRDFFILSHAPLQWIEPNGVMVNIFGHVHDQDYIKTVSTSAVCVCVERWDYYPVKWEKIEEELKNARLEYSNQKNVQEEKNRY